MNDSNAMIQSVKAKKRVTLPDVGLFSDGTAVKLVGEETFRVVNSGLVDDYIEVNTDAVCAAIKDVFTDTRSIVEPAGALGGGRHQAVRGETQIQRQDVCGDFVRRQHEF